MNRRILAIIVALALAIGGGALVISYARNADARAIAAESPAPVWVAHQAGPGRHDPQGRRAHRAHRADRRSARKAVPAGALRRSTPTTTRCWRTSDIAAGRVPAGGPVRHHAGRARRRSRCRPACSPSRSSSPTRPGSARSSPRARTSRSTRRYKLKDLRDTPEAKIFNDNDVHGTSLLLPDVLVIGMGDTPLSARQAEPQPRASTPRRSRRPAATSSSPSPSRRPSAGR